MYIKDVTIEGFKSYATRVHIPNFDPQFNAITGLNGTGKSNILDAICFVLGITNLSQVRAGSLLDLVYKKGQAGVTEAVVCITFDNSDKERSPTGFEDKETITVTRQIVVGGRNKYRLNGKQATPTQIHDFFRGVQLNVNNPHFLIMQGRITQVLNMKPPEILGMLEEVAGTKMYEEKRYRAFQIFDKKTQKIREFDQVMKEDLKPTLDKLKEDRDRLLQFTKAQETVAELERFCIAYSYASSESKLNRTRREIDELETRKRQVDNEAEDTEAQIKEATDEMKRLEQSFERQYGSTMQQLRHESEQLAKILSQQDAELQSKLHEQNAIGLEMDQTKSEMAKFSDGALERDLQQKKDVRDKVKRQEADLSKEIEELERELGQLTADGGGISSNFLSEKLESTKIEQLNDQAVVDEMEMKCRSINAKLTDLKQTSNAHTESISRSLHSAQNAIQQLTARIEELRFDPSNIDYLKTQLSEKESALNEVKERKKQISREVGDLNVVFEDPHSGFDRSCVKGIIGSLFRIKEQAAVTALEVAGGGKLKHLVVDTVQTANAILKHGKLRRKMTIIPLDKIRPDILHPSVIETAKNGFGTDAVPAMELIECKQEYQAVMQYAFGRVFICRDNATAKAMAYHPAIRTRCVTLDGNDYNPSGILTSGHRSAKGAILQQLYQLNHVKDIMRKASAECEGLQEQIEIQTTKQKQHQECVRELEIQTHSASETQRKIEERAEQAKKEQAELSDELQRSQNCLSEAQMKVQQLQNRQQELEYQLENFDGNEAAYVEHIKSKSQELRHKHTLAEKTLAETEHSLQSACAMQRDVDGERERLSNCLAQLQGSFSVLQSEIDNYHQQIEATQRQSQEAAFRIEQHRADTQYVDDTRKELAMEKRRHEEKLKQHNSEKRNLTNKEGRLKMDVAQLESQLTKLTKSHSWIEAERRNFGQSGSAFDWSSRDANAATVHYEHAKSLIKTIGKRVVSQYEMTQQEYRQLSTKHKRVMKDRQHIEQAIVDLDERKAESIRSVWEAVNREFGSIFSTLLPGANARMEPPEGESFLTGLEVKVALGGVWKQSLSELSGGQRSLLALSLILSILLFRPAPFYILDEVDSALDLSHTQNIGQMIKRFFPQSQFIVVSLKDGMFSNANVLFKTQFANGVSAVTRTVPDKRS